jgi:hypothetical protein
VSGNAASAGMGGDKEDEAWGGAGEDGGITETQEAWLKVLSLLALLIQTYELYWYKVLTQMRGWRALGACLIVGGKKYRCFTGANVQILTQMRG